MKFFSALCIAPAAAAAGAAAPGALISFDGAEETSFNFKILNDPVMGGQSTGSWSLGSGFGILDGEVVDVPSLSAPGFIKAAGDGSFPDISDFADGNLVLSVRTSTPEYAGYRVTLVSGAVSVDFACASGGSLPLSRGCYKEKFSVPAGSDFVDVKIPFNTFSDKWSSATGEHNAECADDASVCLTAAKLSKIKRVEFWGEGANGKLHLEVQSVSAESVTGQRVMLAGAVKALAAPGLLVTFDGAEETSFNFKILNDPVMGGQSTGSWSLGSGFGILDGEVVDVPSLSAPGFIKAAGDGSFPDISAFADGNLVLSVRTSTPEYAGYRVTLVSGAVSADFACASGGSLPLSRGCYKEKFSVPSGSDFVDVKIPFNTFSDKWSSATGEHNAECADDASVCLTAAKLSKIKRVEFWGEGANGKLHLEVQSISAESATGQRVVLA